MDLIEEPADFRYVLRSADGRVARVNDRVLQRSFLLSPDQLMEDWAPSSIAALTADDLAPAWALNPEVILLGCGETQAFPHASVLAACLQRGIGLESMVNAAAARTYNVLAGEGRKVVAAFLLAG